MIYNLSVDELMLAHHELQLWLHLTRELSPQVTEGEISHARRAIHAAGNSFVNLNLYNLRHRYAINFHS